MLGVLSQIKENLLSIIKPSTKKEFIVGYQGNKWNSKAITLTDEEVSKCVLIIGSNGLGQQFKYFYPTMDKITGSFIVVDDGRHYEMSKGIRKNIDEKILKFDITDDKSSKFNWIPLCKNYPGLAYRIAEVCLFERSKEAVGFHKNLTAQLLALIWIHCSSLESPMPKTAYKLICETSALELMKILSKSTNPFLIKRLGLLQTVNIEVIEGYLSLIKGKLDWLAKEEVVSFTDTTEVIDFRRLRQEKIGVNLSVITDVIDEPVNALTSKLSRIILTCALRELMQYSKGKRVYLFVRYLTALSYLSYLSELEILVKNNISLIGCLQSFIDPFLSTYGEAQTKHILSNFHSKIFLEKHIVDGFVSYLSTEENILIEKEKHKEAQAQMVRLELAEKEMANRKRIIMFDFRYPEHFVLVNGREPFVVEFPNSKLR